jgi:hypothetical protein
MSSIQTGTIQSITLKDDDPNEVYSIQVLTTKGGGTYEIAYPIDVSIKRIPLLGESVVLLSTLGAEASGGSRRTKQYYLNPTSVQLNIHNNALPKGSAPTKSKSNISLYSETESGTPNVTKKSSPDDLGKGFVERTDVGSLQPFIGDVLIEGRFGHSLRFGYSPTDSDTTQTPSWQSSKVEDPITILSNGRKQGGSYNKFIIENVDDDLSSVYLTSSQKIKIKTSQTNLGVGVDAQSQFDKPSVIITSDRVLLNSKNDYVILSGDKGVNIATPAWAMDMDKMFTILEGLIRQLADLTSGTATFATGVGPTGPATNVAQVQQLLTELKQMAQ